MLKKKLSMIVKGKKYTRNMKVELAKRLSFILSSALVLGIGLSPVPLQSPSQGEKFMETIAAPETLEIDENHTEQRLSEVSPAIRTQVNPGLIDEEGQLQGPQGRLVVKLSSDTSPEIVAQDVQAKLARRGPLQFITLAVEPSRMDEVTAKLKTIPGVLNVSPSQEMKLAASAQASVTDPYYSKQWGLKQIQAPKAWNMGATGEGVIVAVVDTGVDVNHPDLADNLVPGYNAITGHDGLRVTQDNNGHGSHVAGIIAADRNERGVVGVAYDAKIMPIKAMDRDGEGSDYIIADGIVWAVDHGAQIINLSIGAVTKEEILSEAVQYASDQGVLIVAAGGNTNEESNLETITYPAADPKVLAVTAIDEENQLASFSLTGSNVSLAAPGTNIMSDYWQDSSAYATSNGTSMASPFVAGAAALVWSEHPELSATQVRQILVDSALELGNPGRDSSYGYGRVDAYWALKFAAQPVSLSVPAIISWAGAIIHGAPSQISAQLEIPARAFGSDPTQTPRVSINTLTGTTSLPEGINPIGESFDIAWEVSTPVQKYLQLSLASDPESFAPNSNRLLYIYHWTGSRWLKIGGGMNSGTVTVGITEPGIYQLGSAAIPQETRLAGADRFETAIQISQFGFPDGVNTVLLARAEDFPDALAGAPLAYKKHAPILLTNSASLPENVQNEIQRLKPQEIILLGGIGAISRGIETQLQSQYSVTRLGGANRYETAQKIAVELGMTGEAVVVNGDNFPDAIAMSSIAAQYGVPILLTEKNELPTETEEVLREYAVSWTAAVGGKGVISSQTLDFLPNPIRLSGQDRYATSFKIVKAFPPQGGTTYLATGENFPDALTGGVLAALNNTNLILVSPEGLKKDEQDVLQGWDGKRVYAFGGSGVVSDSSLTQIQNLLQ